MKNNNYFPMPKEIFCLGLNSGEIAVYTYLMYCEDRKTFQCYPSYNIIGKALKMSKKTVMKYVKSLEDKCLKLTQEYNITPSMSRCGNPYDNALAENFFSILKTQCIYRVKLQSYEEARLLIGECIHFYNHQRIQLKTKLTPLEKRCQCVA